MTETESVKVGDDQPADIFISYARADEVVAARLADCFKEQGWRLWWDDHLRAGEDFRDEIQEALENARVVVVLWTENSIDSRWVKEEAEIGMERDVLVPVLLEDVRIPMGFKGVHAADLREWDGHCEHGSARRLFEAIRRVLGQRAPAAPSPDDRRTVSWMAPLVVAAAVASVCLPFLWKPEEPDTWTPRAGVLVTTSAAPLPERVLLESENWKRSTYSDPEGQFAFEQAADVGEYAVRLSHQRLIVGLQKTVPRIGDGPLELILEGGDFVEVEVEQEPVVEEFVLIFGSHRSRIDAEDQVNILDDHRVDAEVHDRGTESPVTERYTVISTRRGGFVEMQEWREELRPLGINLAKLATTGSL